MKTARRALPTLFLLLAASALAGPPADRTPIYDPLVVPAAKLPAPLELTVHDAARNRDIPLRVYLPASPQPAPVVLFSHGLGGSREGNAFMGRHWAGRGYVAVFLQHPGSDTAVWRDQPATKRFGALRQAASLENFLLRVKDVPAALDQLSRWNQSPGHALKGRLDLQHIGMSGHSFGAVTTEAVSGQSVVGGQQTFTDPRISAAIAFSPSAPKTPAPERAFGRVQIPWLLMTGTLDRSPIGQTSAADRLKVFPALPKGRKYELVLDHAEHSAFTDRALPGDKQPRNPNHHRAMLAISTAFWDAYLKQNAAAKAWLDGPKAKSVLEKKDRWQVK